MKNLDQILSEHPFFEGLDSEHLKLIAGCAKNEFFEEGKYIYREGEDAKVFHIIREGQVAVEIFTPQRGPIILETIGEGDMLGWSWMFPPYRWRFNARAVQPTRAVAIDGECIRKKCEENHAFGYQLIRRVSEIVVRRLQATRLQLLDLYGAHG